MVASIHKQATLLQEIEKCLAISSINLKKMKNTSNKKLISNSSKEKRGCYTEKRKTEKKHLEIFEKQNDY